MTLQRPNLEIYSKLLIRRSYVVSGILTLPQSINIFKSKFYKLQHIQFLYIIKKKKTRTSQVVYNHTKTITRFTIICQKT